MKIVTLNLWNGGRLFNQAKQFLIDQNADIYFLQEVYDGHVPDLENRLRTRDILQSAFPDYFSAFAPAYLDTRPKEGNIEEGLLLLSRYELTNTQNLFIDVPYGPYDQETTTDFRFFPSNIQKATITVHNQIITLLNIHGPVNNNGTEDTDRRLKMKDTICTHITDYSILAGDFNVSPQTQTIRALEEKLTNVFAGELSTSFNIKRKDLIKRPGYATAVVDMIFVTPTIPILKKEHPDVDVSDHLPLIAQLDM
jgi:endonuclease/exonuclease/phosphatase family metal-dependent hydrolase